MIYLLILRALLGPAIVGQFDSDAECRAGAERYVAMLLSQRSDDRHNAHVACVGFPITLPQAPETKEA